jgi:predicted kinase
MGEPRSAFIVISGLPGSGKSTLARRLSAALGLTVIDKDDILERLFEQRGIGGADRRRALSRESDAILQREAMRACGAVLVSFWRLPGMRADSGTPAEWLEDLSPRPVHIRCVCAPELAAQRFTQRRRHVGHLDKTTNHAEIVAELRQLAALEPLALVPRIDVDTSKEPVLEDVIGSVRPLI